MIRIKNPLTVVASGTPDLMARFYDYDGTLLSGEKIKSISALPTPPVHEGLTFLRWSRTLDAIKASEGDAYVYGVYKPTDGKSRVRLSFTSSTLATTLWFSQTKSEGLEIDWGDGSEPERVTGEGTVSVLHTYAARGSYTITLTPDDDCEWSPGSGTTTTNNSFVSNTARAAVTSVELGDGATTFPQYCFYGFSGMMSILMPEEFEQTSIGKSAFYGCSSLTSVIIPDGVTSITGAAFGSCSSLAHFIIPSSVVSIGSESFAGCLALDHLILPSNTRNLEANQWTMFRGWENCKVVTPIGGGGNVELEDRTTLDIFSSAYVESVIVPNGVRNISGFGNCNRLRSIQLPDGLLSVADWTFDGCSMLEAVDIPAGVKSLGGSHTFSGCTSLRSLIARGGLTALSASGLYSVQYCELGSIGNPVSSLSTGTFNNWTQSCPITIYTMPQYVTTLINNTRNGAINATIIIKAASDTVYEGVAYAAGETMVTSNPTV